MSNCSRVRGAVAGNVRSGIPSLQYLKVAPVHITVPVEIGTWIVVGVRVLCAISVVQYIQVIRVNPELEHWSLRCAVGIAIALGWTVPGGLPRRGRVALFEPVLCQLPQIGMIHELIAVGIGGQARTAQEPSSSEDCIVAEFYDLRSVNVGCVAFTAITYAVSVGVLLVLIIVQGTVVAKVTFVVIVCVELLRIGNSRTVILQIRDFIAIIIGENEDCVQCVFGVNKDRIGVV